VSQEIIDLLGPHIRFPEQVYSTNSDNIAAFCPFHKSGNEQKPSFYVYIGASQAKFGSSYCHTCQEGWSLLKLVGLLTNDKSLAMKARQLAPAVPKPGERSDIPVDLSSGLSPLPDHILGMFDYAPKALLDAGFGLPVLKKYDIGFDRARKRITFPIRTHMGQLVGISGRTVVDDYPRYKIYLSELLEVSSDYSFKKGRVLWGLDKFYADCMSGQSDMPVIVCEGFKQVMWVVQSGYPTVVGLIGSSMTREQQFLLTRITSRVVLFLDNDEPGIKAMDKIINRLCGIDVRVANYRTAEPISPDDLPAGAVRHAIETAINPFSWRNERVR